MCVRCVAVPNMPRVGGTMRELARRLARQTGRSSSSSASLSSLQAITTRSSPRGPRRSCVVQLRATRDPAADLGVDVREELELPDDGLSKWALPDDEHPLRRRNPPPERAHSGAEDEAEAQHSAPDDQPVARSSGRAPETARAARVRSAVLLSVHTTSQGNSSTVRCRSVRWSRSYRPASFAMTIQIGAESDEQQRGRGTASPEPHGDRRGGHGQDVSQREHPSQQRLRTVVTGGVVATKTPGADELRRRCRAHSIGGLQCGNDRGASRRDTVAPLPTDRHSGARAEGLEFGLRRRASCEIAPGGCAVPRSASMRCAITTGCSRVSTG